MRAPFWLPPVFLAASPALSFYASNTRIWVQSPLFLYTGILAAGALLLAFAVSLLLKSAHKETDRSLMNAKAGVLVSLGVALFFSYGPIHELLVKQFGEPRAFQWHVPLTIAWVGLFAFGASRILRTRRDLRGAISYLTVLGAGVVVINTGLLSFHALRTWGVSASLPSQRPLLEASSSGPLRTPLPDVYYIIVDRYPDAGTLKDFYAHDNTPFLDYLRGKGFYVATESRSNYLKTAWSLASSLNMDYINYLTQELGPQQREWTYIYPLLEDYRVWHFLRQKGYRFIHVGSDFEGTRYNRFADENVNDFSPHRGYWELVELTPLDAVGDEAGIGYFDRDRMRWERTRYEFQRLANMPHEKGPKFVFVHLIAPHPPYIFDRDGSFLPPATAAQRTREENFRNQLLFVNAQLQMAVDKILAESSVPPIILLQGDEGPFPVRYEKNEDTFDWRTCTLNELREKTGILNAYYLPGVPRDGLYPSISPVNSFRLVFNLYFGTHFRMLGDETYAHVNDMRPYDFFTVTARLRPPSPPSPPPPLADNKARLHPIAARK